MSSTEGLLGKVVGHYRVMSVIGQGGMGVVYRAEDVRLGRAVAVKFVPEALARDRAALDRFQREARSVSSLNHPNICTLHDIGEYEDRPFLVMECLEGRTLAQRIAAGQIPVEDLLEMAIQMADALDAAHAKGIIHRDIKPGNIFLTARNQIKILDFGLAKATAGQTGSNSPSDSQVATAAIDDMVTGPGFTLGTVAYMSPEQASGEELDCRTDLFSFGNVLYEMATGVSPFHGTTTGLTYAAILHQEPQPPTRLRLDLPAELERIILKALEKSRDLRYQTAAEMRGDLKRVRRDFGRRAGDVVSPGSATDVNAETIALPRTATSLPRPAPAPSATLPPTRTVAHEVSSAEYIVGGIKRNRRTVLAIGAAVLLAAAGGYWYLTRERPLDSLAVLPFTNMAGDPNLEYLSDGISESIINNLSQVPKLAVRSFSSTQRYKSPNTSPDQAGKELKVRGVVTGRVVRRGEDLAISAELVDVDGNRQLWGSQYTIRASDVLATQEQISREISEKLRLQLSPAEKDRLKRHSTQDSEAYQLYLQGRFQWNKRTLEGLQASIDYFQQAVQKDPSYALAYAGQADAYASLADFNVLPTREVMPKVRSTAAKAIELDDTLAEAHTSLGWARFHDWDWPSAEKEFKRAIALNGSYPTARLWYADFLDAMGRFSESQDQLSAALETNQLSPVINLAIASRLYLARQYPQSIEQCQKTLAGDPGFAPGHLLLGRVQLQAGQAQQALAELKKALDLSEGDTNELAALGYANAVAHQPGEAARIVDALKQRSAQTYVQPLSLAVIYAGMGNANEAFDWLRKAFEDRSADLVYLKVDPVFDPLRSDPRFADWLQRIGLTVGK